MVAVPAIPSAARRHHAADCHGPRSGPNNPYYPELAGQYADYLALQLSLFKSEKRGGTAYVRIMHSAAKGLDESQMRSLALYYASLGQEPGNTPSAVPPNSGQQQREQQEGHR
ncbi:c-type cytochrome [Modicisalibacter luteus]|uniref:Cytochrome c n=1 Tax=Modicisalibacter luteus TaxID=453962 RepID=A0ABV7LYN3_9GAMM|nr:hypothetical protein GCM10007159_23770 [Halomonas lutea]